MLDQVRETIKLDRERFIVMETLTHESGFNVLSGTHGNGSKSVPMAPWSLGTLIAYSK